MIYIHINNFRWVRTLRWRGDARLLDLLRPNCLLHVCFHHVYELVKHLRITARGHHVPLRVRLGQVALPPWVPAEHYDFLELARPLDCLLDDVLA